MSWLTRSQPRLNFVRLHPPRAVDPNDVRRAIVGLLSSFDVGPVCLETEVGPAGVIHRLAAANVQHAVSILSALIEGLTATEDQRSPQLGVAFVLRHDTARRALDSSEPSAATASILGSLATHGVLLRHQVLLGRRLAPRAVPSKETQVISESPMAYVADALLRGRQPLDSEARKALVAKQSQPGAVSAVLLRVPEDGAEARAARYLAALRSCQAPGLRLKLRRVRRTSRDDDFPQPSLRLNADEIVTLLAWPYGDRSYPGIDASRSTTRPAHQSGRPSRVVGVGTHPGTEVDIGVSVRDALRHMHVLGPTGTGKSTLLVNLILQDINEGRGLVVIDPKGDLVDDVLARVPSTHYQRLALLDPSSSDPVVGFNPLAVPADRRQLAVDNMLHIFKSLYASSWGPRTQDVLHSSLLTLAGSTHGSIIHVPDLLTDPTLRRALTGAIPHGSPLRSFWNWFDDMSSAERANVIAPVLNKLRPFTLRPGLRAMLGSRQPLDMNRVFTNRAALLVPLRKGLVGSEVAQLIGALVLSNMWQLAQARADLPSERRAPVLVYADEFQEYTRLPMDFGDALAQARGLGVGMVLAHQNLDQLDPPLRASVRANAQNKLYFRLGSEDASTIARNTSHLRAEDFIGLPKFHAYASLLEDAELRPIASIRTLPAPRPRFDPSVRARELIERWGSPRSSVGSDLSQWADAEGEDGPIGKIKRGQP